MTNHSAFFFRRAAIILSLLCLLCACALSGCSGSDSEDRSGDAYVSQSDNTIVSDTVQSVTIVSSSDFICAGSSLPFAAQISKNGGDIRWSSSDAAIATVDQNGVVTGVTPGQVLITASAADGSACDSSILRVAKSGLIFLSPSRQTGNVYFTGDTTECDQAYGIAGYLEDILLGYGCEVYVCPEEPYLGIRAGMAKEMDAICYIAIHTNAGDPDSYGTTALFHPSSMDSISLALALYNEVAELTPTEETQAPFSGMGRNYAEIREPYRQGIPATLLEVEYHDKPEQAQWIIDHHPEIADAIATGIMKWLSLQK